MAWHVMECYHLGAARMTQNVTATPIQRMAKVQFDPTTGKRIEINQQEAPHRKGLDALFSEGKEGPAADDSDDDDDDVKKLTTSDYHKERGPLVHLLPRLCHSVHTLSP